MLSVEKTCPNLLGLATTSLGNEGAGATTDQEQLDTEMLPFERMIQASHLRAESKQCWKVHP